MDKNCSICGSKHRVKEFHPGYVCEDCIRYICRRSGTGPGPDGGEEDLLGGGDALSDSLKNTPDQSASPGPPAASAGRGQGNI